MTDKEIRKDYGQSWAGILKVTDLNDIVVVLSTLFSPIAGNEAINIDGSFADEEAIEMAKNGLLLPIMSGSAVKKVGDAIDNAVDGVKNYGKFGGKQDTYSKTSKEAFNKAKDQNGIPRSQQPDKTIKANTPEGEAAGLDSRNIKQYEFTNSKGKK